jgi:outer membrane biosynthesis protein TonB
MNRYFALSCVLHLSLALLIVVLLAPTTKKAKTTYTIDFIGSGKVMSMQATAKPAAAEQAAAPKKAEPKKAEVKAEPKKENKPAKTEAKAEPKKEAPKPEVRRPSADDMNVLDKLIDAALEDFVLTDEERSVLLKKSKEIGLGEDEFKIYLNGKIQERMKDKPAEKVEEKKKGFFARLFG